MFLGTDKRCSMAQKKETKKKNMNETIFCSLASFRWAYMYLFDFLIAFL